MGLLKGRSVGLAAGLLMAAGCASSGEDKGYFLQFDEAKSRGGIGGYLFEEDAGETARTAQAETGETDRVATRRSAPSRARSSALGPMAAEPIEPLTLYFPSGSAEITASDREKLNEVGERLAKSPETIIMIDGFADAVGPTTLNHDLSRRRAQSVKSLLNERGARDRQVILRAHGESEAKPLEEGQGGNQEDRKAEIGPATSEQSG
ncbi:MAG TPA: OmpA family protein [Bdellovibrionota bacterium]|nr:OmpA family protein [Bdellovibrionota bacterium]